MNSTDPRASINWSVFDQYEEGLVTCGCGQIYRSHTKLVKATDGRLLHFSRRICPSCGSDENIRRVSSPPERYIIGG